MPRDPAKHPLDDRVRAEHMLIAARDITKMAAGRVREDLETDMLLRRAMVNAAQEIGEAAAKISDHGRERLSRVEWKQIVGMRNRLVHGYDQINFDIVWAVATEDAPTLIESLSEAFKEWPLPPPPSAM